MIRVVVRIDNEAQRLIDYALHRCTELVLHRCVLIVHDDDAIVTHRRRDVSTGAFQQVHGAGDLGHIDLHLAEVLILRQC